MKKISSSLYHRVVLFVLALALAACGTGPFLNSETSFATTSFESGATGVALGEAFTITFGAAVDTDTINSDTFFIVTDISDPSSLKYAYVMDETICDPFYAIDATTSCSSNTTCTIAPDTELEPNTDYALCLSTGIRFLNPNLNGLFDGQTIRFTTAAASTGEDETGGEEETIDTDAPTVAITSAESTLTASSPFTVTITFSEEVVGFELSDTTVTGASVSSLQETTTSQVYTVSVTPSTGPITVTLSLAVGVAEDAAGNVNTASNTFTIRYDTSALTVAITSSESVLTNAFPIPVTITFSEEVTGFVSADVTTTNTSVNNFASSDNKVFTLNAIPTSDGTVAIDVAAGVATDTTTSAKSNTAAAQFSITFDATSPNVESTVPADGATNTDLGTTVAVTFTEAMDTSTISTNTANTSCSGSLQVSDDGFVSCIQMTAGPVASNSDKTFTVTPAAALNYSTNYKIRSTTGATDTAGNSLASAYTAGSGFTTTAPPPIYLYDSGSDTNGHIGNRTTTTNTCTNRKNSVVPAITCTNIVALLAYAGDDIAGLITNYGFIDGQVVSPTGTKVVDNWADLLDGSFDTDLQTADVTDQPTVWTGSDDNGTPSQNCGDWNDNTAGATGATTQTNSAAVGLSVGTETCDTTRPFLCICQ